MSKHSLAVLKDCFVNPDGFIQTIQTGPFHTIKRDNAEEETRAVSRKVIFRVDSNPPSQKHRSRLVLNVFKFHDDSNITQITKLLLQ